MSKIEIELFDFERLKVYQKSLDLIDNIYDVADQFPAKETYNLALQFKRAANSVSLNIGEGSGGSRKEFIKFLTISRRSLRECVVCTTLAFRRKYIDEKTQSSLRNQLTEISKMLSGFINYLESETAKTNLSEPTTEYATTSPNSELITPNL
jgi:four helix bundle protein